MPSRVRFGGGSTTVAGGFLRTEGSFFVLFWRGGCLLNTHPQRVQAFNYHIWGLGFRAYMWTAKVQRSKAFGPTKHIQDACDSEDIKLIKRPQS